MISLGWICAVGVGSGILVYQFVGWLRAFAVKHLIDVPNARSSHRTPTPRGGGIGIASTLTLAWLSIGFVERDLRILCGGALFAAVAGLGLWDDVRSLSARVRLLVQLSVCVGTLATWGHLSIVSVPLIGVVRLSALGPAITVVWIVGLLNAYNFMDGIDGIAGIQGVCAGLGWLSVAHYFGAVDATTLAAVCVGSCCGFLGHNWPPAKIFMGDVGSTSLGYQFAIFPLIARRPVDDAWQEGQLVVVALLCVWPFVFDVAFTFFRRAARRQPLTQAHRSHLYQRCSDRGWSHQQISSAYGLLAALCSTVAFAWVLRPQSSTTAASVLVCFLIVPPIELALAAFPRPGSRSR